MSRRQPFVCPHGINCVHEACRIAAWERWHQRGIPGCVHEDDDDLHYYAGTACDCPAGNAAVDAD